VSTGPSDRGIPAWTDSSAYEALVGIDRSLLAWEWLRRVPAYRERALRAVGAGAVLDSRRAVVSTDASSWGLHAFEDPRLDSSRARPVWRSDWHGHVLAARAVPARPSGETLDLARLETLATLVVGAQSDHLLLADGRHAIRLDLAGGLSPGPVRLHYDISGLAGAEPSILALRRLIALVRDGRFSRALHPAHARSRRLVLALRAWDALEAGACQRDIAALLLNGSSGLRRWRVEAPSLRSRAQRLSRSARMLARGGWAQLLD